MEVLEQLNYIETIDKYLKRLFPIVRSITGEGNRQTLRMLQDLIPLEIKEYSSGTPVYDWIVPKEWVIRDAWIKNQDGVKIVDYKNSNLHVVNYSQPIHKKMSFTDLKDHLYYLTTLPDAIPYRTSYYHDNWGFCVSYEDVQKNFREEETYEICIDTEFVDGSLSVGELCIAGRNPKEILISTYICHPSLANDNLSGPILTALLARELLRKDLNYSYRIVFIPETIGAITYCAHNQSEIENIDIALIPTTVGGPGGFGYKQSWQADNYLNQIVEKIFKNNEIDFKTYMFDPHGSDERQYSSPGFRINCVSLTKDKYYEYPYYHTSLDNLNFVKAENINRSLNLYFQVIEEIEETDQNVFKKSRTPVYSDDQSAVLCRSNPYCEVMLSRHNLYPKDGGSLLPTNAALTELDLILWLLFLCDGVCSLKQIADKLNIEEPVIKIVADKIVDKGLLEYVDR